MILKYDGKLARLGDLTIYPYPCTRIAILERVIDYITNCLVEKVFVCYYLICPQQSKAIPFDNVSDAPLPCC